MARVLVIDDDRLVRGMMRRALKTAGHEVMEAENGYAGLALFARAPADLVVTDILMPDKEGIATIRELRQQDRRVRILAVSGGGTHMVCEKLLGFASELGANDVLAKPFRGTELIAKVAELLAASQE